MSGFLDWLRQLAQSVIDALVGGIRSIIDSLLASMLDGARAVIALFPQAQPIGLDGTSGILIGYAWLNSWLPVAEVVTALGILLTVGAVIFAFRTAVTVWDQMPFQ